MALEMDYSEINERLIFILKTLKEDIWRQNEQHSRQVEKLQTLIQQQQITINELECKLRQKNEKTHFKKNSVDFQTQTKKLFSRKTSAQVSSINIEIIHSPSLTQSKTCRNRPNQNNSTSLVLRSREKISAWTDKRLEEASQQKRRSIFKVKQELTAKKEGTTNKHLKIKNKENQCSVLPDSNCPRTKKSTGQIIKLMSRASFQGKQERENQKRKEDRSYMKQQKKMINVYLPVKDEVQKPQWR